MLDLVASLEKETILFLCVMVNTARKLVKGCWCCSIVASENQVNIQKLEQLPGRSTSSLHLIRSAKLSLCYLAMDARRLVDIRRSLAVHLLLLSALEGK